MHGLIAPSSRSQSRASAPPQAETEQRRLSKPHSSGFFDPLLQKFFKTGTVRIFFSEYYGMDSFQGLVTVASAGRNGGSRFVRLAVSVSSERRFPLTGFMGYFQPE